MQPYRPLILTILLCTACRHTAAPDTFVAPAFRSIEVTAGENSAQATARIDGQNPVQAVACGFEYWPEGAEEPEKVTAILEGNSFTAELSPLEPGTQYSLRGWLDSGRSVISSEVSLFQTKPIPHPVVELTGAEAGLTDARLSALLERSDNVSSAGFYFWKEDGTLLTAEGTIDGLSLTVHIEGLDPFTHYGYAAFAVGLDGEEVRSGEGTFRTLDLPVPVLSSFSVEGNGMDWTFHASVQDDDWVESCGFRYTCLADGTTRSGTAALQDHLFSDKPTGLYYSQEYAVQAFVRTAQTEVVSESVTFQTPENPMDPTLFNLLLSWYDANGDGVLNEAECAPVKRLYLTAYSQSGPRVINGLDIFPNLTEVSVVSRYLTDIDLDDVPSLTTFRSTLSSGMTTFRIRSRCPVRIELAETILQELSVSGAPDMKTLIIPASHLETVDLSCNSGLETLTLSHARLKELDLRGCTSLQVVDVTGNPALSTVRLLRSQEGIRIEKDSQTQIEYE